MSTRTRGLLIFGGAFNPPHLTHRRIILTALEELPAEKLLVLPSGQHPHKQNLDPHLHLAPAEKRLELCRLAFGDLEAVEISALELQRPGAAYTVDTLEELGKLYPGWQLYWLLGADNLALLHSWHDYRRLPELATLVTFPRRGHSLDETQLAHLEYSPEQKAELLAFVLETEADEVSASDIREALRRGERPEDIKSLDPRVAECIRRLGLYGL